MNHDLVSKLRYGVCQDQNDEVEIWETEELMREAADIIDALQSHIKNGRYRAMVEAASIVHRMAVNEASMSKAWRNGCMDAGNELLNYANKMMDASK
jgi:hypothetical protein